jgi:hypothetical protein
MLVVIKLPLIVTEPRVSVGAVIELDATISVVVTSPVTERF